LTRHATLYQIILMYKLIALLLKESWKPLSIVLLTSYVFNTFPFLIEYIYENIYIFSLTYLKIKIYLFQ